MSLIDSYEDWQNKKTKVKKQQIPISDDIEDLRIKLDSVIKKVGEKYRISDTWKELCKIKDNLGLLYFVFKDHEDRENKGKECAKKSKRKPCG